MCIIKFSTQQHNGIYNMTNNWKVIISVRGGELTFFAVFSLYSCFQSIQFLSQAGATNRWFNFIATHFFFLD